MSLAIVYHDVPMYAHVIFCWVSEPFTKVKYIDPTYMIRAIKPNANDSRLVSIGIANRDTRALDA